jgi:hypothetical protein
MRIWGDPVEYKEINIYPIRMKDCTAFYENVSCLMYEKNKIQDVRVIKMDYLSFLFAFMQQDEGILKRLESLLKLTLQDQVFDFLYSEAGSIFLQIENVVFSGFEFDNLRKIILDVNGIRIEEILDSEMEEEMRKLEEYSARESGIPATLEERIITLHCLSHIPYQDIRDCTIFQFNKTLERFAIIKNFEVYSALMAEHGASKDTVHFLSHIEEKGRFENLAISKEDFNKINSIGSNS